NRLRLLQWLAIPWRALAFLGFGDSGRQGFARAGYIVHNIENPLDYCEACPTYEDQRHRRVHNVFLRTFLHSDAFATENHAAKLWLPFLLGLQSWDYWDFHRLCAQAVAYEKAWKANRRRLKAANQAHKQEL